MQWYDFFSFFYDSALEKRYHRFREQAFCPKTMGSGRLVLDLACGTGQNFGYIRSTYGDEQTKILGVDFSKGMLKKAEKRAKKNGWQDVYCLHKDAREVSESDLLETLGAPQVDCVVCALGLSAIPDWKVAFGRTFTLLKPGGRYVIFDVHAEERGFHTRKVEWVAKADACRRVWEPLEEVAQEFSMEFMDNSEKEFGGRLFVASGLKAIPSSR